MLLGTYEQACVPWSPRETPVGLRVAAAQAGPRPDHARAVRSPSSTTRRWARSASSASSTARSRSRRTATRSSGPVRGLRGYWVACGVMAGLSQGGGVGLALATWMTAGDHGDSGMDIWAMDVARYGDYATLAYTNAKVQENYRRRFRITFPNEELPGARPLLTTPIYDRLTDRERGLGRDVRASSTRSGSRSAGLEPKEEVTFRRSNAWDCVAEEVAAVRERVGHDRDLELRQVPGHRAGRRGLAVVAAHGADAGARADHADRDAQRRRPDRRASSRSPGRPTPTSSTSSGRCRPRSTTRAGSATTCRPTGRSASRCSGWASSGCPSPGRARATCSRRSRRTSTSRPRPSRS